MLGCAQFILSSWIEVGKCYEGNLRKGQRKEHAHVVCAFNIRTTFTTYSIFTCFYFPFPNLNDVIGAHHCNVFVFFLYQILI